MEHIKRILSILALAIIIVLIFTACLPETQEALLTSPTTEVVAETIADGTPTPRVIPTYVPTPTPVPIPTRRPTAVPIDIEQLLSNVTDKMPKMNIGSLNVPKFYLGDGVSEHFSSLEIVTEDIYGNVYYTDKSDIFRVDAVTGKTANIFDDERISELYDVDEEYYDTVTCAIYFINETLYALINYGLSGLKMKYAIVDVFNEKIITTYDGNSDDYGYGEFGTAGYYGNRIIIYKDLYEQTPGELDVYIYDLSEDKNINMFKAPGDYNSFLSLKYVSDKYFIAQVTAGQMAIWKDGEPQRKDALVIVDKDSMKIADTIYEDELNIKKLAILCCINEWMVFLDAADGAVKIYNIENGEVTTYKQFGVKCSFLGYDAYEHCLYLRQSIGYNHMPLKYNIAYGHGYTSECISEQEIDTAKEVFVKFDIMTRETEVLNEIMTKDYISGSMCLNHVFDCKVGDYIVSYKDRSYQIDFWSDFRLKFKLGEEVDYDTWRD